MPNTAYSIRRHTLDALSGAWCKDSKDLLCSEGRQRGSGYLKNPGPHRRVQRIIFPGETISRPRHKPQGIGTVEFKIPDYEERACLFEFDGTVGFLVLCRELSSTGHPEGPIQSRNPEESELNMAGQMN